MDFIIDRILNILSENNISVYSLARTTGINQSTLHKILHFERTMKPKHFYCIIDNLPITLSSKNELINRYDKATLGDERYNAKFYIIEMLKKFSDTSFSALLENPLSPLPNITLNLDSNNTIYKGSNVQTVINMFLISEMHNSDPKAYIYVPGDVKELNSYIVNVIKLYKINIKVTFMIDFINKTNSLNANYNLRVLQNILPIALSASSNFSFYYTYVNAITNDSYMTPYPYFIAMSESVIWINSSFDEIMVIYNADVAKNLILNCEGKLTKYKKLLEVNSDVNSIVKSLITNQGEVTTHYCIEYEPCFSMYFTKEMINAIVPENIPKRSTLIDILYERYEQLNKIKSSIQIFNGNSLIEFAKTGIIKEFPSAYSRPCNSSERLYILNSILDSIDSDKHIIRAIEPVYFNISDCLSLIIQDEACIQFSIWNDKKIPMRYFAITESSLCKYFYNFINDIIDTNMIYSKNKTKKLVQNAIDNITD